MTHFHRILITGSRDWAPAPEIYEALYDRFALHGKITIIQGDCDGADLMAKSWAREQVLQGMRMGVAHVRLESYPAPWDDFDKAAGPIRNKYMVQLGADECLAFPLPSSRGTIGCMKLARAAGIPVVNLGTLPKGTLWH